MKYSIRYALGELRKIQPTKSAAFFGLAQYFTKKNKSCWRVWKYKNGASGYRLVAEAEGSQASSKGMMMIWEPASQMWVKLSPDDVVSTTAGHIVKEQHFAARRNLGIIVPVGCGCSVS